jgi:hypothetical protein
MFEIRVLRIFGLRKHVMAGSWRNLLSNKLHNLYSLPRIIRISKSSRTKQAKHLSYMRENGMH